MVVNPWLFPGRNSLSTYSFWIDGEAGLASVRVAVEVVA
jgi:hypothetical protein